MEALLNRVDAPNRAYKLGIDINQPNQFLIPVATAINDIAKQLMPYARFYAISTSPAESVAANVTNTVTLRVPGDMIFVWTALTASPSAATMNLRIISSASGIQHMSSAIPYSVITGIGRRPYYLSVPTIFQPNSIITLEITNTGGTAITPNISFLGHAIDLNITPKDIMGVMSNRMIPLAYHYWHITDVFPITVTTTRTDYATSIFRSSDFIAQQFLVSYTADFNVYMRETGTGHEIIRNGRANNIFGVGEYNPFLPYPLVCKRGEELVWTLWTDSGTSTAYIVMGGIAVPAGIAEYFEKSG